MEVEYNEKPRGASIRIKLVGEDNIQYVNRQRVLEDLITDGFVTAKKIIITKKGHWMEITK